MNLFKKLFVAEHPQTQKQLDAALSRCEKLETQCAGLVAHCREWQTQYESEKRNRIARQIEIDHMCEILRAACDCKWKNETPIQMATIAANSIYWARQEAEDRKQLTTQEEVDAIPVIEVKYHCPHCWSWGHIHEKTCPNRNDGMKKHVHFEEKS